jgi:SAM-dependent methyltransferase
MDGARLAAEREFHDSQAADRALTFARNPDLLTVADDQYLDHESWIRPALARLGSLHGLRILDFGCGHAMASVVMARQGASVTAFDLSRGYLAEARSRASQNGVQFRLLQADGNRLPFATGAFDRVWGNAILHHLDLSQAAGEIARVLAPNGRAVFCEPWGGNWFLRMARNRLGYASKHRTVDEEPLQRRDLECFHHCFEYVEFQGFQLLSMAARVFGRNRRFATLDSWDKLLLKRIPRLRNYCRYVVLTLRQPLKIEFKNAGILRNRRHEPAHATPVASSCEA